jgi:HEAT repeat protein
MGYLKSEAEEVIPMLIQLLHDNNQLVRISTLLSLGEFGAEAKDAIPELVKLLSTGDESLRASTIATLWQIDPEFQPDEALMPEVNE